MHVVASEVEDVMFVEIGTVIVVLNCHFLQHAVYVLQIEMKWF